MFYVVGLFSQVKLICIIDSYMTVSNKLTFYFKHSKCNLELEMPRDLPDQCTRLVSVWIKCCSLTLDHLYTICFFAIVSQY